MLCCLALLGGSFWGPGLTCGLPFPQSDHNQNKASFLTTCQRQQGVWFGFGLDSAEGTDPASGSIRGRLGDSSSAEWRNGILEPGQPLQSQSPPFSSRPSFHCLLLPVSKPAATPAPAHLVSEVECLRITSSVQQPGRPTPATSWKELRLAVWPCTVLPILLLSLHLFFLLFFRTLLLSG